MLYFGTSCEVVKKYRDHLLRDDWCRCLTGGPVVGVLTMLQSSLTLNKIHSSPDPGCGCGDSGRKNLEEEKDQSV